MHDDLLNARELVYDKCGFVLTDFQKESESEEYKACTFTLNGIEVRYRASKITPTKTGQFVTIWRRNKDGITVPFNISDPFDLLIVSARCDQHFGQFIFPKSILLDKGIISGSNKEGKRGIRVYPPWDMTLNKQAINTQQWQVAYFLGISRRNSIDYTQAKKLLNSK